MEAKTIQIPHNFNPAERPYQLEILDESSPRNKVIVVHRRAGKTSLAVNKLIIEAMKPENRGRTFWYIAPTYKQAKDVVWNNPNMLFNFLPEEVIKKKNETELWVKTVNNTMIQLKGAEDTDSLLGNDPYGIIVDETQSHASELYDRVLKPVLDANGGWIWFLGTPRTKDQFYRKYVYAHDHPKWQPFHLSAEESNIISRGELENTKKSIPMDVYRQDYLAQFLDTEGMVFRNVQEICTEGMKEPKKGHYYSIGVDLARKRDFTVIMVYDRCEQAVVHIQRFRDVDWSVQRDRIEAIARRYASPTFQPSPIKIDATGVGDPIYQDLVKKGLRVEPVIFTNKVKENLITEIQVRFDHMNIKCPNFRPLIDELSVFEETTTPSGRRRFSAPEDLHDDCVFALGLALRNSSYIEPKLGRNVPNSVLMRKYAKNRNRYAKRKKSVYNLLDLQ